MNEMEYLQKQAAGARAAIAGTARSLVTDVERTASPSNLFKRLRAQLWVLGAAVAAAGFAGSAIAGHRRAAAKEEKEESEEGGETEHSSTRRKVEGVLPLITEILSLARPVISAVMAVNAARSEARSSNGHEEKSDKPPRAPRTRKRSS